ncbi:MAG: hypothetical protein H6559_23180 [Lewinellaceae bacterium]|nr:hypothetical protein [Lewinellaceae bacterium]
MGNAAVMKPALPKPPTGKPGRRKPPFFCSLTISADKGGIKHGVQMARKYIEGTEGHVYLDEEGNPEVIPEIHEKLETHKKRRDKCIQYAALAIGDGYRACYTCPDGQKTIFLRAKEVWKYGETCDYESRKKDPEYEISRVVLTAQNFGIKDRLCNLIVFGPGVF